MDKNDIGTNAGLIWRTLNQNHQAMTLDELASHNNLSSIDVAAAVGWLAREDKISFHQRDEALCISIFHETYF